MRSPFIAALLAGLSLLLPAAFPATAAMPEPPVMRLGDAVQPLAYDLELTLTPSEAGFSGQVVIDVEIARPLDFFWINGTSLTVEQASLATSSGFQAKATATAAGRDFIGLQFDQPVPAGRARLTLQYTGEVSTRETRGLFRQQDRGDWYLFSQFEATYARRAFPSFDEPHWKTPWRLALVVPTDLVAAGNAPVTAETPAGAGRKRVQFAPTPPLPTYLVALAVGPFDVVDGGRAGRNQTSLRYLVGKGRGGDTAYAREVTPKLLQWLEGYFDHPYPYDKLDSVAIPFTQQFAAMENPGLITYRSSLLVVRPEQLDERSQQRYASIAAHEIAHQWFGNLVTMDWWTDLWLNEAFATWMARKTLRSLFPEWEWHMWQEWERTNAASVDRLSTTRRIRQEVRTPDDLGNAFDGITYDKGGAVLNMFETAMGETAFRDGVRRYIARHAWRNASATDFFAALAGADRHVLEGFASFVDQPGLPLVDARLDCEGPRPAVRLQQRRHLPARPTAPEATAQKWTLPVCLRYEGQPAGPPSCTILREPSQRLELPGAPARCPAWLLANPGGTSYYLSQFDAPRLQALVRAPLQGEEVVSLLGDLLLLVNAGDLPAAALLEAAAVWAADARPDVVRAVADAVRSFHLLLLTPAERDALPAWVRRHFGPQASELGWLPRANESDRVRKLRLAVVPLVAGVGQDPALQAQARALALNWLAGRNAALLGGAYRAVLLAAASDGDASLFDAFEAALAVAPDVGRRLDILRALGQFADPALRERGFALAIGGSVELQIGIELLSSAGGRPENAEAVLAFAQQHFAPTLAARLPDGALANLPRWHGNLCSQAGRRAVEALYGPSIARYPGGPRNLAQTLEVIEICAQAAAKVAR